MTHYKASVGATKFFFTDSREKAQAWIDKQPKRRWEETEIMEFSDVKLFYKKRRIYLYEIRLSNKFFHIANSEKKYGWYPNMAYDIHLNHYEVAQWLCDEEIGNPEIWLGEI